MSNFSQKSFPLIILLPLLLPCFLLICLAKTTITNITTDQLALLSLKSSITELPSHHILAKNWTVDSSVCDWIGVTCGTRHQRVTILDLSDMNLTGTIPPQLGNLSFLVSLDMNGNNIAGELPDEFARLGRLKALDLRHNNLNGQFPSWIGSLRELEALYLGNNNFSGVISPSISNMSKLIGLSLGNNNFEGEIPTEIFNMSSLERISLRENGFSASSLPDNVCQLLPRLQWLDLEQTGLIGLIPSSIGQCSQLQRLYLSSNSLTGEIPRGIGNLKELQQLALWDNQLQGAIPKEIGNLSLLHIVDFNTNNLTGGVPEEIGKLSNIYLINFSSNKLFGSIPVDIFNTSTTIIAFGENNISGTLPSTMCYTLPNLKRLYLTENSMSGVLPDSISGCSNLEILDLSYNDFVGKIPNSLGNLTLLQIFALEHNNFISDPASPVLDFITSLGKCIYLQEFGVAENPLDGFLPDSVGNLSSTLELFHAYNCKIKGTLPTGLGNLSSLNTLTLRDNQLTGAFPDSMRNLEYLQRIELSGNKMSISLQIFCACPNLGDLALTENLIVGGTIPDCLGNITSLRYLYLASGGLNSTIPTSLWNLEDLLALNLSSNLLTGYLPPKISNLKMATSMDFSRNNFSGEIPTTISDLQSLQSFSLAHNQLEGSIPEAISEVLSLERLDLSYNLLSGSLPMSLEKLRYLTFFNVSFNNLRGEIPSRGPFANLTAESFISNQALCGAQKFHVPICSYPSTHYRGSKRNVHEIVIILVTLMSVVSTLCLGFIYLKYWRKGKANDDDGEVPNMIARKTISYYELLEATEGYSQNNLLGVGSFGSVYKGTLENSQIVAVKVFNLQLEGSYKSFDIECKVLRNLRHRNLVKVISTCSRPDFKALVLDFMPNGSLDRCLHSNNYFLNIMQRLNILIDVAYALHYLHGGNLTSVAHCDLKPSNVLLDKEMVAHVSDFGISKLLDMKDNVTYTNTLATLCYVAPEYALEGLVSTRCDIYSFGIMMMEVFTRKRPSDGMFGENLTLRNWVQESMPDRLSNVIDIDLLSTFDDHLPEILCCISSIMEVALTCTNVSSRQRSNIDDVLASLNKIRLKLLPYAGGSH